MYWRNIIPVFLVHTFNIKSILYFVNYIIELSKRYQLVIYLFFRLQIMKEWNDLQQKYEDLRKTDKATADQFKKKMTHRFQVGIGRNVCSLSSVAPLCSCFVHWILLFVINCCSLILFGFQVFEEASRALKFNS